MKIRVVFLRDASPYAGGEVAGFDEAEARRLAANGIVAIPDEEEAVADTGGGVGGEGGEGAGNDGAEPPPVVAIPDDWKTIHHATKKKLAREISGEEPADTAAAEAVIEAELARRAAEQA